MTSVIPRAPQWSAQPVIRTVTFQVEPPQKEQCPTLMDQPNLPTQRITPNESTYPLSKHVGTQAPWKLLQQELVLHPPVIQKSQSPVQNLFIIEEESL